MITSAYSPELERELQRDLVAFAADPLAFARYVWPWGERELADSAGPRRWQTELLRALAEHLENSTTRHRPCRLAVASGHGVGKSSLVGMLINWALSTCEHARVTVTADTGIQLSTKTAPEVNKWFSLAINRHWFDVRKTSVRIRSAAFEDTWRADFLPWSVENSEAFAGLHNKGRRILVVYDEASAIADKIWEVTEGALTDAETEIIWVAFGNPTRGSGRFFDCFHAQRDLWRTWQVDSRTVEGTNKAQLAEWVESYGEDSDFCRVRVRGEFPRVDSNQFISPDVVYRCRRHVSQGHELQPKVLAVDVARFGACRSIIALRQGRLYQVLDKMRGLDVVQVAQRVAQRIEERTPDAVVVDSDGLGAGVFDYLRATGWGDRARLFEFHGGEAAVDPRKYFNRRAEVWGELRDALVAGAQLDDDPEVEVDLVAPEYGFSASQQLQLERKEHMQQRGAVSPDIGDTLAMTHAVRLGIKTERRRVLVSPAAQGSAGWME